MGALLKKSLTTIADAHVFVQLGVGYVDLYLIHFPRLAVPDIPTIWAKMEKIKEAGLARCVSPGFPCSTGIDETPRSIGVSNFDVKDLDILLASAKIKPAVNQVRITGHTLIEREPL